MLGITSVKPMTESSFMGNKDEIPDSNIDGLNIPKEIVQTLA